ncbi:MAG TPA: PAS domain-containing protein, partial [Verrucomicrobiae bacterium]|nr:PAS domain-containing protein [Verrucomicrobiae bacterium]
NEELVTVNEELQDRNEELTAVNSDVINLLNNVSVPVVMLTGDLRIRRFTPLAEKALNLIPSDVGRPLSDLRTAADFPEVERLAREVMQTLVPQELEVTDPHGSWHVMRVRPYMTVEKKIDGVVLTLADVDAQKRAAEEASRAKAFAEAIIQTVREPLLVLDAELRVVSVNNAFCSYFRTEREGSVGHLLYELGGGDWDIPRLRELLEEILPRNKVLDNFAVEHDFRRVGKKRLLLNARRLESSVGANILLAVLEREE